MAIRQATRFCSTCGKRTLHQKETFSNTWGCLLTILTGGAFLVIWILADLLGAFKPYRCQTCGQAYGSTVGTIVGAILLVFLFLLLLGLIVSLMGN